ncbi:YdeI family protein [Flagellimonas sp. CMM7]|uniref:YdeI/OmpD-associated family protein n=1 Tax=Flagellimonas sp. CMM7 TaxID=2654676 RepID=UPI0013D2A5EE|nr:YdeI/OmpD-associated family protein [Flagellimonas sp. CMM7]UII78861.1 YdeI/OmpD-associated family protein [Flagellimonas sp. CMM7]
MEKAEKLNIYYQAEHPFREGICALRELALQTKSVEDYKWNIPVYTINGKNVFGICRFKNHFGVWFYNGVFLKDPKKVLRNAQEGKTKAMRHWYFSSEKDIDKEAVLAYMVESIENQEKGLSIAPEKSSKELQVPTLLKQALVKDTAIKTAFEALSPYKQKEFCEYILEAKQEKTKARRLEKILPMIKKGMGLNDAYR